MKKYSSFLDGPREYLSVNCFWCTLSLFLVHRTMLMVKLYGTTPPRSVVRLIAFWGDGVNDVTFMTGIDATQRTTAACVYVGRSSSSSLVISDDGGRGQLISIALRLTNVRLLWSHSLAKTVRPTTEGPPHKTR